MIINKKAIVPRVNIELDGQVLEQVSFSTYLGQTITEDGKCDEEIKRKTWQARSAFNTVLSTIAAFILLKTVKVLCVVHPAVRSWDMDSFEDERKTTERIWNVVAQTYDACKLDESFVEWKRP